MCLKKLFKCKVTQYYVSDIDKFLAEFDRTHPQKSLSQKKEIAKYKRISDLRDNPVLTDLTSKIWDGF